METPPEFPFNDEQLNSLMEADVTASLLDVGSLVFIATEWLQAHQSAHPDPSCEVARAVADAVRSVGAACLLAQELAVGTADDFGDTGP